MKTEFVRSYSRLSTILMIIGIILTHFAFFLGVYNFWDQDVLKWLSIFGFLMCIFSSILSVIFYSKRRITKANMIWIVLSTALLIMITIIAFFYTLVHGPNNDPNP